MSPSTTHSQSERQWLSYTVAFLLATHNLWLGLKSFNDRDAAFVMLLAAILAWYPFLRFRRPDILASFIASAIVILVSSVFGLALCDFLWGGSVPLFQYPF